MSPKAQQTLIIVAAVLLVLWYLKGQTARAAAAAGEALNPTNPENLAYSGVNAVGEAVTGRPWSFGAWIWELMHPEQVEAGY